MGDKIRVHYKGTLAQTGLFHSSDDWKKPADLTSRPKGSRPGSKVIPGMKVGGKRASSSLLA